MPTLGFELAASWLPTEIVYGGAFDPPHEGHTLLVKRALEVFPEARVRIVPAASPAGAHGLHKQTEASFAQRLAMCQLAFANEGSRVTVDPIEEQLPSPNYTIQTLEALAKTYPEERLALLMGKDQLQNFAGWLKPREIIVRASLLVVDRDQGEDLNALLAMLGPQLGRALHALGPNTWQWEGLPTGIFSLGPGLSLAASRLIRGNLADPEHQQWLSPAVLNYVKSQGLYSS